MQNAPAQHTYLSRGINHHNNAGADTPALFFVYSGAIFVEFTTNSTAFPLASFPQRFDHVFSFRRIRLLQKP